MPVCANCRTPIICRRSTGRRRTSVPQPTSALATAITRRASCCCTARCASARSRGWRSRRLRYFGAETRIFDPSDLPLPDQVKNDDHPAVRELREHALWSEGQVWCSPERHGQITGVMKAQIDHLPLSMGAVRPTQGRTLAVMQVSGGSQSFNAVNSLRLLGRWMRMFTIPNQSSVAKAWQEFDANNRMRPSSYYERIVDVMEELVRITVLMRPHVAALTDRYSERREAAAKQSTVVAQSR
jgi:arsenical resistance protein ArsH